MAGFEIRRRQHDVAEPTRPGAAVHQRRGTAGALHTPRPVELHAWLRRDDESRRHDERHDDAAAPIPGDQRRTAACDVGVERGEVVRGAVEVVVVIDRDRQLTSLRRVAGSRRS
jgi:hypothetical protein